MLAKCLAGTGWWRDSFLSNLGWLLFHTTAITALRLLLSVTCAANHSFLSSACFFILGLPLYIGALTFYPSPMWLLRRLLAYSVCLFFFIIPKPQMHSQCWTLTLFTSGPIYLCPGVATFCILLNLSSDPNKSFFCETLPFYWSRADTHSCLRFCSKHLFNDMNVIACFVLFKPNSHNK